MLVNLTPHPIRIYPTDTPDRIRPDVEPLLTIEPSPDYPPARLTENRADGATTYLPANADDAASSLTRFAPVVTVEYGGIPRHGRLTLPRGDDHEPHRTWFVVSLVVALAALHRSDLLVPYREVRNLEGSVIGCRMLARPTRAPVMRGTR